jgi:hypothetical protein
MLRELVYYFILSNRREMGALFTFEGCAFGPK